LAAYIGIGTVLALALFGAVVRWSAAPRLYILFLVLFLGAHLAWPYPEPRYFLAVWPLLLMLACRGLPDLWQILPPTLILASLALSTPRLLQVVSEHRLVGSLMFRSCQWVSTNVPAGDVIATPVAYRMVLLTGHPSIAQQGANTWGEFMASVVARGASWVHFEYASTSRVDITGDTMLHQPPGLDQWMARSSWVQVGVVGPNLTGNDHPFDAVYRVVVDPGTYVAAWSHFLRSGAATSDTDKEAELRAALHLLPDFPDARDRLAVILLVRSKTPPPEALQILQDEVRAYPVDVRAGLMLSMALRAAGRAAEAQSVWDRTRAEADRIGDTAIQQQMSQP
jgi:hypothetical protein